MILVTGGGGFIGSNLAAALEARGHRDIAVCDWFGNGDKWRNLAKRAPAEIVAPERIAEFLDERGGDIDIVFHLGAISTTTETDVDLIVENNVRLSSMLWDWCAGHETRLIYASSAATYGNGSNGFDDDGALDALAALRPMNPYGWSKHVVDRRFAALVDQGAPAPPQWAGLKFFNVYGPNEYHKTGQHSVVLKNFREIRRDGRAVLFRSHRNDYTDGGQLRDFIWVGDCIDVMLWLYDNEGVNGLFNVGTGQARSFADLAGAVCTSMGVDESIAYVDTPEPIRDSYQYYTQAEMGRLRAAGYAAPFTTLEDGVGQYVTQFLATSDPYL